MEKVETRLKAVPLIDELDIQPIDLDPAALMSGLFHLRAADVKEHQGLSGVISLVDEILESGDFLNSIDDNELRWIASVVETLNTHLLVGGGLFKAIVRKHLEGKSVKKTFARMKRETLSAPTVLKTLFSLGTHLAIEAERAESPHAKIFMSAVNEHINSILENGTDGIAEAVRFAETFLGE